jgi:ligand-binding SRPBCC domain-containing protein
MACRIEFEQWVPFPIEKVFLFLARPSNLPRIMPPKTGTRIDRVHLVPPPGGREIGHLAGVGSEIITSFRVLPFLPFRATWVARITEFEWDHHFADVQEHGPFRSFHHRHALRPEIRDGVVGTAVMDVIELAAGLGWLGKVIEKLFVRRQLEQIFQHRQRALAELLAQDYAAGSTNTAVP